MPAASRARIFYGDAFSVAGGAGARYGEKSLLIMHFTRATARSAALGFAGLGASAAAGLAGAFAPYFHRFGFPEGGILKLNFEIVGEILAGAPMGAGAAATAG